MKRLIAMAAIGASLGGAGAMAGGFDSGDVVNGDFENGDTGWTFILPTVNWEGVVQTTGGNPDGNAYLRSPFFEDPGSEACVEQTFVCGSDAGGTGCEMSLDYYLMMLDAGFESGRLHVFLDDELIFASPSPNLIDWTTLGFTADCGAHTLRLCIEVDPGNHSWIGRFDNVTAECLMPVPVESVSWGDVKAIYR